MFAQIGYYICVPFAWLTRLFYSITGSYGIALILFTLVVKLVLLLLQRWRREVRELLLLLLLERKPRL